jgi:hypothetical protein
MTGRRIGQLALAAGLAAAGALAWCGYRRPDFVLWLGNSLLLCT